MDRHFRGRRHRSVLPDSIERIAFDRDQFRTLFGQRLGRGIDPGAGMYPGIITDPSAAGGMVLEPGGHTCLRHRLVLPVLAIDLFSHLQRIAPVDKDRGFLGQDHRRSRRPAKTGQPGETLGIGADIFAHMLIADRHDETVEPIGLQLFAQGFETVFIGGHGKLAIV